MIIIIDNLSIIITTVVAIIIINTFIIILIPPHNSLVNTAELKHQFSPHECGHLPLFSTKDRADLSIFANYMTSLLKSVYALSPILETLKLMFIMKWALMLEIC